jgi:hypothetical protein
MKDYIKTEEIDTNDVSKNLIKEKQNISLTNALREDSTLLINFVLLMFIWSIMSISYYINSYMIQQYYGSIVRNLYAIAFGEMISAFLSRYFFYIYGFKKVMGVAQIICMIGGLGIIFIEYFSTSDTIKDDPWILVNLVLISYGLASGF